MASVSASSAPQGVELPTISVEDYELDLAHVGQDQIAALYARGLPVIVVLITAILDMLRSVLQENQGLRERVTELEHQLHRDSHNILLSVQIFYHTKGDYGTNGVMERNGPGLVPDLPRPLRIFP